LKRKEKGESKTRPGEEVGVQLRWRDDIILPYDSDRHIKDAEDIRRLYALSGIVSRQLKRRGVGRVMRTDMGWGRRGLGLVWDNWKVTRHDKWENTA
jgi:hypothetical protein